MHTIPDDFTTPLYTDGERYFLGPDSEICRARWGAPLEILNAETIRGYGPEIVDELIEKLWLEVPAPYTGYNAHRITRDGYHDLEADFHELANSERMRRQWDLIIFGTKKSNFSAGASPDDYLTDREKRIVGSLLQWLGTPIGISFLHEAGFERRKNDK